MRATEIFEIIKGKHTKQEKFLKMNAFEHSNFFTRWYEFTRLEAIPPSPKVSLPAVESKEQIPAQELLEGGLQIQKSPEPEVLSTQEDLFDQSNKTGTKSN